MKPLRIVFMGCVQFSHSVLKELALHPHAEIVGVITRSESPINSDFESLEPFARRHNIPVHLASGNEQLAIIDFMKYLNPDVLYCFGWSYLLNKEVTGIPRLGSIGYHPAALPQNRGRHPLIWALALGLKQTASTFFFMTPEADAGDLLNQKFIDIDDNDDAASLYSKMTNTALDQIRFFTSQLARGDFPRIPQDHLRANCWRKRSKADGLIDWRMSSRSLYNLVRALTRPYVGAHCFFRGEEVKVWKVRSQEICASNNLEPGKVLAVDGREVLVKCGEGALLIQIHEFKTLPQQGDYL